MDTVNIFTVNTIPKRNIIIVIKIIKYIIILIWETFFRNYHIIFVKNNIIISELN